MPNRADRKQAMSRRRLLQASAVAGVGLGLGVPGLIAPARAQAQTTVTFAGWAFEPQVVEANVKRFMEQNPDLKVVYTPLDLNLYSEKMVALFNAGSQPDSFYVRDLSFGAWVEAGWIQPIDGLPGLAALNDDIYPFNLESLFYKGKQYGTPYYGDIYIYIYDTKLLAKAGIAKAPVTLDELTKAALEVKKAGIAKYPILKGFKTNSDGLSEFWSMVIASGGHLFNEAFDPLYPYEDKTAVAILEWMVDSMHGTQILDPTGLELDETQVRDALVSGQGVFTSAVGNVFPRVNNPALSKRAGDIQLTRFPGLKDLSKGTMGWTRFYCISSKTKVRDAAWRLIAYMGGKDKNGTYYTAKDWYLKYGVGYAFKSLDNDPDIKEAHRKAGYDLDILSQQSNTARPRENIGATWYLDWDNFTQQQIQRALLRQVTPLQALEASAKRAQELKKNS